MRCANCGYVSFDYLSECKKCRTDLAGARESIGFIAAKPAVPFLLGSLINMEAPAPQPENPVVVETQTLNSFSFPEELTHSNDPVEKAGDEFRLETPQSEIDTPNSANAASEAAEEDFSLLDLSDEELELLIDKDALGYDETDATLTEGLSEVAKPPREQFAAVEPIPMAVEPIPMAAEPIPLAIEPITPAIEFSLPEVKTPAGPETDKPTLNVDDFLEGLGAKPSPKSPSTSHLEGEIPSAAVPAANELVLDFDDPSLDLDTDLELTFALEPISESSDSPAGIEKAPKAPAALEPAFDPARPQTDDSTDDFVIELSDNDLDALLEELGGTTPKGAA